MTDTLTEAKVRLMHSLVGALEHTIEVIDTMDDYVASDKKLKHHSEDLMIIRRHVATMIETAMAMSVVMEEKANATIS
jgi:hypothetical protein